MRLLATLLLGLMLTITACGKHPQDVQPEKVESAIKQQRNMADMQPQFLYLAAQAAIKDGELGMAIELLSALLKKDPEALKPRFQLLDLLLDSSQFDQATKHISALLQRDDLPAEKHAGLKLAMIRIQAAQDQIDEALIGINNFLNTHPSHLHAYDILSKLLASQNRYDEALAALDKAIKIKELPKFRLLQAQLFIKKNHLQAAKTSLKQMQKLAPHHDTPILLLSSIALKEGRKEQAESLLRSFLGNNPAALRITQALGQLLLQDKRPVEAILLYRDAAKNSPNQPEILHALSMLYFHHRDYAEAEKTFLQLIKIKPDDRSRFYLAASLEAQDRMSEARIIYQKLDPSSSLAAEAQLRLAAMDVMNNDIPMAVKRLKGILNNDPKHLDALLMLSTIRLNQAKHQLLVDETEAIIATAKLPPQLLFNRAVAFEQLKQYEQVEKMLMRVMKAKPNHAEAMNFLAYTYAIQGIKLGKAEALLHRALILKPDNGYYLDSLAWVYYKNGQFAKAINTQAKALKHIDDDAVMHEHYGDMLWRHGDSAAARQAWQLAITLKSERTILIKEKIAKGLTSSQ